ncbi:MAG: FG-GAP repeat protein, partial [Acidimicrobiales bacterium]|nr:FG-GAP repeat protein [Acidimicrobiales bacterium]
LFLNSDGTVKAEQTISGNEGGFGGVLDVADNFGSAVAPLGDLDGDGMPDVAIGARNDDDAGTDRGAVYIVSLNADGTVRFDQKISDTEGGFVPALADTEHFGESIAPIGDLDGDGRLEIAVGAPNHFATASNQGGVWILSLNGDGTVFADNIIDDNTASLALPLLAGDLFGYAVAAADVDDDTVADLIVGMPGGASAPEAVHVLFMNSDFTVKGYQTISATEGGPVGGVDAGDWFGGSIGVLGDLSGSGLTDIVVGQFRDDDGAADTGAVFVLELAAANTNVVNSTGDAADALPGDGLCDTGGLNSEGDPACTLRAAIQEANAVTGVGTITFAIPATDPGFTGVYWSISPTSALPAITDRLLVDGATQPGFVANTNAGPAALNGTQMIEIDGSSAGTGADGIIVDADDVVVRGLVINGFGESGVVTTATADRVTIAGTYIGTSQAGVAAVPNGNSGVELAGPGAVVGGDAAADRNLIGGNTVAGVAVTSTAANATIEGNLIGTDAGGTPVIANGVGVHVDGAPNATIDSNVVAGNTGAGIEPSATTPRSITITANSIHTNGGLGIDWNGDGITLNDWPDTDNVVNRPFVQAAHDAGAGNVEVVLVADLPAGDYSIQAFANPGGADPTGFGEGQTYVGSGSITSAGTGPEYFTIVVPGASGDVLSLTVLEDLGAGQLGSTSEFSTTIQAGELLAVNSTANTGDAVPGDGLCDTGGLNSEGDPECTLRAAIDEANASVGHDTITFSVPGSDPGNAGGIWTIDVGVTPLPDIVEGITIDASTQSGYATTPVVELVGLVGDGLHLTGTAGGSTVRALAIGGFTGDGIELEAGADRSRIVDNHIGLDAAGTTANALSGMGIRVAAAETQIGDIGGGNHVGASMRGIVVAGAAAVDNQVVANVVGTGPTGAPGLGTVIHGVAVEAGAARTVVGGPSAAHRNVIVSSGEAGVVIDGETTDDVVVEGNWIGLWLDGLTAMGNAASGVGVDNDADSSSLIDNVIVASGQDGISITGASDSTSVQGNFIGTDSGLIVSPGSGANGVLVGATATNTQVGGLGAGQGNTIAGSGQSDPNADGVRVLAPKAAINVILSNEIYDSAGLAIDADVDGPTVNDAPDIDEAVNHPTIDAVVASGGSVTIDFTVDAAAGAYHVQIFGTPAADPTG